MFDDRSVVMMFLWLLQAFGLFVVASFCFDVVHWLLHRFYESKIGLLKAIGGLHHTHHEFLDTELKFNDALIGKNFWRHRTWEFVNQVAFASIGYLVLPVPPVALTQALFTLAFIAGIVLKGKDSNHRASRVVPAPTNGVFVGWPYHSLHHLHPLKYFSSVTTTFDKLFGTGCQIAGRSVVLTGSSGAFGAPMKKILESEGAEVTGLKYGVDYTYDDYARAEPLLSAADILVLAHGSRVQDAMAANCDSFLALIERFRRLTRGRQRPPEVWALGSEIECHPAWGNPELQIYLQSKRAFARHARRYFHQTDLLYRHIVPSAFSSQMGPGLMSGELAAAWAWFLIKRGYRYVPVSYTGIALLNYLKFAFRIHAQPASSVRQITA
jgi:hypothetical protein